MGVCPHVHASLCEWTFIFNSEFPCQQMQNTQTSGMNRFPHTLQFLSFFTSEMQIPFFTAVILWVWDIQSQLRFASYCFHEALHVTVIWVLQCYWFFLWRAWSEQMVFCEKKMHTIEEEVVLCCSYFSDAVVPYVFTLQLWIFTCFFDLIVCKRWPWFHDHGGNQTVGCSHRSSSSSECFSFFLTWV